ncbi:MAG: prepilin-type N-terminal cleavage/methylation domain-containing protein [Gemmatimonadales bacterium]|jgi:prepilin-type N-terminal cleavage/methylation domain-containing protein
MNRRGFTLVELLVSLVLVGIVAASIYQLLLNNQRIYLQQTERVDLNATIRAAVAILPSELREASATDTMESDILALSASSITFKAMRNLYVLCQTPSSGGTNGDIVAWAADAATFGLRDVDADRDSMVVFAEADPSTRSDNYWLHANVRGVTYGTACPGGAASATIRLSGISPSGALDDVVAGAPARGYQVIQVLTYTDARGDLWLGRREHTKTGWSTTQPLLGPLAASGLQFTYYDENGVVTTTPADLARVEIMVIGSTTRAVRASDGTTRYVVDTLTTQVALRNNRRDP